VNDMRIWHDRPSSRWEQGLPIGNGRLGGVVYGGPEEEVWAISEATFWSGRRERTPTRSRGRADLDRAREFLYGEDFAACEQLASEVFQAEKANFGTNLPMCDVRMRFGHAGDRFERELSLDRAVVSASYTADGIRYERETFATNVSDVIVSRIRSSEPGRLSFALGVEGRTPNFRVHADGSDTLVWEAHATETRHSDGTCGTRARGRVQVELAGGSIRTDEQQILIEGADEAVVYFAASTDYDQRTADWWAVPAQVIGVASTTGYEHLRTAHVDDYRGLFNRVTLDLGASPATALPTDRRIALLAEGGDDPQLLASFYQFGRYLMISGSRANSPLPLNLQGLWNDGLAAAMGWSCDYHLDVNTQMNYYPAESGNLGECVLPLTRFLERLAASGREVAHDFYGCEGWVAHVFTNAWGFSAPGWNYIWGVNVTGGLWLAAQLRESYQFSGDRDFLERSAYPILRESAMFFLDYMVEHPGTGWLVTGPSNSPENCFVPNHDDDAKHYLSMGPTMDQVLVRDLFSFCHDAAKTLGVDLDLRIRLERALDLLPPLMIGADGHLQEWLDDYIDGQPDHRHMSHLYALFPGGQITPSRTPELAAAARVSLERRQQSETFEDVEFTLALFAASYARLCDGDAAKEQLDYLIGELCLDNLMTYSKAGIAGATTPIFVVDGNFGGAAAIAEMLLQSHDGAVHLLPALPTSWPSGSYTGLRARGNVEVDAAWQDGALTLATLRAFAPGRTVVRLGDRSVGVELEAGVTYSIDGDLHVTAHSAPTGAAVVG
jgi:alpha-L-fucosidase 2